MSLFSGLCIAYVAFQSGLDISLSLQWFLTNKNNFKIYLHAHKKLPWNFHMFVFYRNAYLLWLLLPVISQVSLLMMFPRIQHINFPWVLVKVFPTKTDAWISLQCFAKFCKTTEVDLQNSLFIFITFHIVLFLKKELVLYEVKYSSEWRFLQWAKRV